MGATVGTDDAARLLPDAPDPAGLAAWLQDWRALDPDVARMRAVNPVYIPRNHLLDEALTAAEQLKNEGIQARVINLCTIKPLDEELVRASAAKTCHVVTAEEHSVIGGLGDAVLAALSESPVPLRKLGVNDVFGESGPAVDLLHKYGLDAAGIVAAVEGLLAK